MSRIKFDQDLEGMLWTGAQPLAQPENFGLIIPPVRELKESNTWLDAAQWNQYWKKRGQEMASLKDIYNAIKKSQEEISAGSQLSEIKACLRNFWIATSTMVVYDNASKTPSVIHNSARAHPDIIICRLSNELPDMYDGLEYGKVAASAEGQQYIRALFGTTDDTGTIKRNLDTLLTFIPPKITERIMFYTEKHGLDSSPTPVSLNLLGSYRVPSPPPNLEICVEDNSGISFGVRR